MASKKFLELQNLTSESINEELSKVSSDLSRMKFDHGAKGLENPLLLGESKKEVARMKTELRAREIKAMNSEDLANRSKIRLRRK